MSGDPTAELRDSYIDLLKRSLLGVTVEPMTLYHPVETRTGIRSQLARWLLGAPDRILTEPRRADASVNTEGTMSVWDLPPWPVTMVGEVRLDNLHACVRDVVESGVPGDLIETGVWRGGATIFMRGILGAYGITDRTVYVADSFAGVPAPNVEKYPADRGISLHTWPGLAVGLDAVKANFDRYGLLDDQVAFVPGWFRDTLPTLQGHRWAVIRVDGDLYESTMDSLENLYPSLSLGGWLIVDDYHDIDACRQAVTDYREREGITEPITRVDWTGICWQKRT